METQKKYNVSFLDAKNKRAKISIRINRERFSISGECNGSMGQCLDEITPRTKAQKDLIQLWKEFHLNDMNPGTEKQTEILKKCKDSDYTLRCSFFI